MKIVKNAVSDLPCGGIAAVGCSSMGVGSIGGKNYCGNLLWQSSVTLLPQQCKTFSRNHLRRGYGGQGERKGRKDLNHEIH